MKNIFKTALVLFLVSLVTSCAGDLDINTDPTYPAEITPGLALSSVEGSLITVTGGAFFNLGGIYSQFYTQAPSASQYATIERYNINTDYANRAWTELYAGALNDAKFVLDQSKSNGDTGTTLIATCLKAYTFQLLVDVFGDVPYEDALSFQEDQIFSPKPTPGKTIYLDLLNKINTAEENYKNNPVASTVGSQDFIYKADMDKWIQFANTLKLKMYLRMAYTSDANAQAVTALLSENNFITEDAKFGPDAFTDAASKRNPFYEVQVQRFKQINDVASNSLHQYLNLNNDPRLKDIYFANDDGDFVGLDQGRGLSTDLSGVKAKAYSRPTIKFNTPVYLLSVAESDFLQAEALIRYKGGAGAKAKYNAGVAASFAMHGVTENPNDFTGSGKAYEFNNAGSVENKVAQVIKQKWVALANVNNIEAWIETTRTKFPSLASQTSPNYQEGHRIVSLGSVLAGNQIPASIFYSDNEVQRNSNLKQKKDLLVKVWWDKK